MIIKHFGENEDTGHIELMYQREALDIWVDVELVQDTIDYTEENYQLFTTGQALNPTREEEPDPYLIVSVQIEGCGEVLKFIEVLDIPEGPVTADFLIALVNDYFKRMTTKAGTRH